MAEEKSQFNLAECEEKILKFWEERRIFEQSLAKNKGKRMFVFYEGPPTANAAPAIHHLEARAFKDVIPRYKTMAGFLVPRRAGWDTHGLPVEIQIEKELGLNNKQDIEKFGIAQFNAEAKKSVWRHKEEWEKFTRRMGYWLDLSHPYITYDVRYMESLWAIIKKFWQKKYLYEDFKVVPWCTRCGTALSSHEVGLGYQEDTDTAVFVKFKVKSLKFNVTAQNEKLRNILAENKPVYILAWTTTPWTLPGNVALAVQKDLDYIKIKFETGAPSSSMPSGGITPGIYILAMDVAWNAITRGDHPLSVALRILLPERPRPGIGKEEFFEKEKIKGYDLMGLKYEPLFDVPELTKTETAYRIYPADFVSANEGTGVVHTAVMYGEDDYRLGHEIGLPKFHTVDETGRFVASLQEGLAGLAILDGQQKNQETEKKIIQILQEKNALFRNPEPYPHDYPHCWRCATPLLYYARKAWWVRVTAVKEKLLINNKVINWIPAHLKNGRFGEFLRDVRDWAFSRERYWGTPLPIWRCDNKACGHIEVLGSRKELADHGGNSANTYFIMRHGESLANVQDVVAMRNGEYPLTVKGRQQAEKAAHALKRHKIDLVFTSPVRRTAETADIIAKKLKIKARRDKRLIEINAGIFTGRPSHDYEAHFSSVLEKFSKRPPKGESLADVRVRMLAAIADLEKQYKGKNILLVSHAYPLWALAGGAAGLTDEETTALCVGDGAGVFIRCGEIMPMIYKAAPRDERGEINLHRPYVDAFIFSCIKCKSEMRRVPEVADVWFDSGAMPFASQTDADGQRGSAFSQRKSAFLFPAEFIAEAVDQTRGWFYTLLAVATLLGRRAPYKNVISLGHVLDAQGKKMSKSKGNVINPWDMMEKYGADALRWYFYTLNAPGDVKSFDEKDVAGKMRGFLMTFWNSAMLFDTYAAKKTGKASVARETILDRWALARMRLCIKDVTEALEVYDIMRASRALEEFLIHDVSQWFLRRARSRLQRPKSQEELVLVSQVAGELLRHCAIMAAPFVPFLSEEIYQRLHVRMPLGFQSVHLENWPRVDVITKNEQALIRDMAACRALCSDALRLRQQAGIKVRQPLSSLMITERRFAGMPEFLSLICDEVNVKRVILGTTFALDTDITPELKEEGALREFVRIIQEMRKDLKLKPRDRIRLGVRGDTRWTAFFERNKVQILRDTRATAMNVAGREKYKIERECDYDGARLTIMIDA